MEWISFLPALGSSRMANCSDHVKEGQTPGLDPLFMNSWIPQHQEPSVDPIYLAAGTATSLVPIKRPPRGVDAMAHRASCRNARTPGCRRQTHASTPQARQPDKGATGRQSPVSGRSGPPARPRARAPACVPTLRNAGVCKSQSTPWVDRRMMAGVAIRAGVNLRVCQAPQQRRLRPAGSCTLQAR